MRSISKYARFLSSCLVFEISCSLGPKVQPGCLRRWHRLASMGHEQDEITTTKTQDKKRKERTKHNTTRHDTKDKKTRRRQATGRRQARKSNKRFLGGSSKKKSVFLLIGLSKIEKIEMTCLPFSLSFQLFNHNYIRHNNEECNND
jgi:hypothetical protein